MKLLRLFILVNTLLLIGCVSLYDPNEKFLLGQHYCFVTYRLGPADQMVHGPNGHTLYVFMSTTRTLQHQLAPACTYALASPQGKIIGVPLMRQPASFHSMCVLSVETNAQGIIIRTQLEGGDCHIILNGLMS